MNMNQPRYTDLDQAIAAEVRAEFARQGSTKNITELAEALNLRRATLSARVNGHQPFTPGQLVATAKYLNTTAEALTQEAERRMDEAERRTDNASDRLAA